MVDPESGFFSGDAAELLKLRIEGLGALEVLTERLLQSDSAAVRQADGAQGGHGDGQRSRRQGQVCDDATHSTTPARLTTKVPCTIDQAALRGGRTDTGG